MSVYYLNASYDKVYYKAACISLMSVIIGRRPDNKGAAVYLKHHIKSHLWPLT